MSYLDQLSIVCYCVVLLHLINNARFIEIDIHGFVIDCVLVGPKKRSNGM